MNDEREIKPGTWVKFYRENHFVIGIVGSIRRTVTGHDVLQTDAGEVRPEDVVEQR
jgi:hypothetical protein